MAKILKLNAISPLADEIFKNYEYGDDVETPDGVMVRSAQMADFPVNENLIAVARAGAGTNNIPVADYASKGIVVFNTPGANANAVKELVICELFLGGRKITDAIDWVKTLKNEGENLPKLVEKGKGKFVGCEIAGKTLGVIGFGAIGILVANAAAALGMKVVGVDPYLSASAAVSLNPNVKLAASREEVYKVADFITVHVPLTPDTRGMFDALTIQSLKDGVVIINNSRGELADSAAVISAVASGKIARYITDFPSAEMVGVPNIICVPHLGASTPEAEDNCAVMAARELADYIENGNIKNSVNFPNLTLERDGAARICILHKNVPDMLAKFTAEISAAGLNVANMASKARGDYEYTVIDTDGANVSGAAKAIAAKPDVLRVRVL